MSRAGSPGEEGGGGGHHSLGELVSGGLHILVVCSAAPADPASLGKAGPWEQSGQGLRGSLLTHRASGQHHPDLAVFPAATGL